MEKKERFALGFDMIRRQKFDSEFMTGLQELEFAEKEKPYFNKKRVLIGWSRKGFNVHMEKNIGQENSGIRYNSYLDLMQNQGKKIKPIPSVTTICGARGSGKTVISKRIIEGMFYSGYSVCHLSDIKNEMVDCLQPNRDMAHLLPKEDSPKPLPVKVYRPYFFNVVNNEELPENNAWFSIPFSTMDEETFHTAFNIPEGDKRRILIGKHFNKAESLEELKGMIERDDLNTSSKNLMEMMEIAIRHKFFSSEHAHDFVDDMNSGFVPILNLQNYDKIPPAYYQMYLHIILSRIEQARISGELKKEVCIFIDEASKIVPEKKKSKAKEKIEYIIDVSRRVGIYLIFAAQEAEDMPEKVLMQSKYIFIPPNYDFNKLKQILSAKGFYISMPTQMYGYAWWQTTILFISRLANIYKGRKAWIKLDNDTKKYEIIFAYPPMCGHEQN